ncbi:hypothetical protein CTAYLR_000678 [Chrysophaeum taylorii]|uniref:Pirin n=1 Tax=Chrysophaeum taylorii TaxID=2483200 RepID=A0AAD7U8T9_9STRA|nr:hypothetical protein CTAYLR_000678 [Chrysophaeum taylorii]
MDGRGVARKFKAPTQREGAGFVIRRSVGSHHVSTAETDPFLMVDELPLTEYKPGEFPGAPWHPHRGMDTVMYIKQGQGSHEDSMGNKGTLYAGDAQWMTAASGIEHNEGTNHPGGPMHGFQVWVNLPKSRKMDPPSYNDISASAIPKVEFAGGIAAVIAGTVDGVKAPVQPLVDVQYVDFMMTPNSTYAHTVPAGYETCIVHAYAGGGAFGAATVSEGDCVLFERTNAESIVSWQAGAAGLSFLLLAGRPLREPVVWHGPFVMNTKAEIGDCFRDLQAGTFIKHKGAYRRLA